MRQKHQHFQFNPLALGRRMVFGAASLALLLLPACSAMATVATPTRTTVTGVSTENGAGATLTATVQTVTGGGTAGGGTVDFLLPSGQSLGSAVVKADGTATLLLSALPPASSTAMDGSKNLSVTAEYHAPAGSAGESYSDSASVATAIAAPDATGQTPDFTVTGNPTTVTVKSGSYGTTVLSVTSVAGYTGSIEFSCSNLPAQVTCAFNPTQQTLTANGTFASTLQISTQTVSGPQASLLRGGGGVALALIFPGALLLLGFSGRRWKLFRGAQMLGLFLVLTGGGLGLSGCSQRYGYLHHPPLVATGTVPGTYTITVAVDGSQGSAAIEHDIPISLVVQ